MAAIRLVDLPANPMSHTVSFVTCTSKRLCAMSTLCRSMCSLLQEDMFWRLLCKSHWYATDERLANWPSLSPCGLYKALETWVPMEGYYVLAPAFPWGLLVLLRLAEGQMQADVIRFIPNADHFSEVMVPLFRIGLTERSLGVVESTVNPCWHVAIRGVQPSIDVSALDPINLQACTPHAERWFPRTRHFVRHKIFFVSHALRLNYSWPDDAEGSDGNKHDDYDDSDEEVLRSSAWVPGTLADSEEAVTFCTQQMITQFFETVRVPCDLALVRGPQDLSKPDPNFPCVRSGLYVGDYGNNMYGQFRTEVLLIDYVTMSPHELRDEQQNPTRIFQRPRPQSRPPDQLQALAAVMDDLTFVRGVKQCGDVHVPMGATTFVAICGPPAACSALADEADMPSHVVNRQTQQREQVIQAWRGWGTLAMQGFGSPSWAGGWLVQLTDSSGSPGDHRFGFIWDRDTQDAVVLHWIRAQDSSPFLQRAWLPSDLQ